MQYRTKFSICFLQAFRNFVKSSLRQSWKVCSLLKAQKNSETLKWLGHRKRLTVWDVSLSRLRVKKERGVELGWGVVFSRLVLWPSYRRPVCVCTCQVFGIVQYNSVFFFFLLGLLDYEIVIFEKYLNLLSLIFLENPRKMFPIWSPVYLLSGRPFKINHIRKYFSDILLS